MKRWNVHPFSQEKTDVLMSYLEPGSVLTWKDMKQEPGQLGFVSVNFIVSRSSNIVTVEVR